ncbi:TBC1 domain family member 12 isoform X1 [Trichosurus vulpecula]|uniref:TBC1 domain family member 12 isoform X1 n=1 Tax=Trichosurus vulpecula TaxID=9337 RepID=UPI00186B11B8|nr:TBC1 domain family member 12 isoform X1 [Trichosurus vulpecula]
MVGPEDAGACPGRKPRLFPPPGPEPGGRDGRMIGATGGRGSCCLEPQEEGEEEEEEEEESEEEEDSEEEGATLPPQRLIQRYLEVAGGQLEPGLCHCSPLVGSQAGRPPPSPGSGSQLCGDEPDGKPTQGGGPGPPHPRMTNGDSGFLLGPGCHDLEAGGLPLPARPCLSSAPEGGGGGSFLRFPREPRCCRVSSLRRPPGADDGGESPPDGATPLEDPLRNCRLGTAEPGHLGGGSGSEDALPGRQSPPPARRGAAQHGGGADERTPGGPPAEPGFRFTDVNLNSRNTYEVSRRQSAPDYLAQEGQLGPPPAPELGPAGAAAKARRSGGGGGGGGFADFFTRNFFPKRTKELKSAVHSAPGWKLFGKVPPRENLQKASKIIQQEYEARTGRTCKPPLPSTRRKNFEFEPLSTTALILEDRPSNLPAKSVEEALRHRQEYDEMVAEAKKREIKEAHKRKQIMKERFKQEENIASAMVIWVNEILPNWEGMRGTRRVRELWWQGLPPSVRGKVWSLAVGNELNITPELYEIFLSRAKERWKSFSETSTENDVEDVGVSVADREASLELIKLDISRTFPSLYIFQKGGPYHDVLHSILGAYTCYRPDVGYVQGMSFIAAVLILNLEEADAFIAFANLLNKPCQLAFFRVDHSMMLKYFATFEVFFEENLSKLFLHFKSYSLTPDIYLIDWIFTLYSKSLPLDLACRVWDVFCRDGEEFLFRTGLGILRLYEDILLQMDFIHIAQFLTKLPEDITSEKLFSCIAAIQMQNSTKKWTQVFASVMKDIKEGDKNHSPALKS